MTWLMMTAAAAGVIFAHLTRPYSAFPELVEVTKWLKPSV
jgi:hypothetical protein